MARVRQDEVLGRVPGDTEVVPRYDLINQNGQIVQSNVEMRLKNPIVQEGTLVDKVAIEECLAASGVATGTNKVLVLNQPNFVLFDGAVVRIKITVSPMPYATLNVNNTGAKTIMQTAKKPLKTRLDPGMWVTLIYSESLDFFLFAGSMAADTTRCTWERLILHTFDRE